MFGLPSFPPSPETHPGSTRRSRGSVTKSRNWKLPLVFTLLGIFLCVIHLRNGFEVLYNSNWNKWVIERTANTVFRTHRIGCRSYPKGGQSCVFSGISCVDVNLQRTKKIGRPIIYFVDDTRRNGEKLKSDLWCKTRHTSADPRYFGPREWPPVEYFAPRQSCLEAQWRTKFSLLGNGTNPNVQWVDEFSLVDFDYKKHDHNNHFIKDVVWMLDVALWQKTMHKSSTISGTKSSIPVLFTHPRHVFLPEGVSDFVFQTRREVNRLNFAIILGLNPSELYRGRNRGKDGRLRGRLFFDAFPSAKSRLIFYKSQQFNTTNDLVCTKKLTVGAKLGNMGHERVCSHFRETAWKLYNIAPPKRIHSGGYLNYQRPPRRVVILQRHITRGFKNIQTLRTAMRAAALEYNFELEYHTTKELVTAEEHVKFFSRVGVLLTTHGSHAMGGMWMPRHGAIIEAFPPGYTDYAFDLLSSACNLWHYEIHGIVPQALKSKYAKLCGKKMLSFYDQCVQMKHESVLVDTEEAVRTVLFALKRLGHNLSTQK